MGILVYKMFVDPEPSELLIRITTEYHARMISQDENKNNSLEPFGVCSLALC